MIGSFQVFLVEIKDTVNAVSTLAERPLAIHLKGFLAKKIIAHWTPEKSEESRIQAL